MKIRNGRTLVTSVATALALAIVVITCSSLKGQASHSPIECASKSKQVKAVTSPGVHGTNISFNGHPGHFDPNPLLKTTVDVDGSGTCLIAHFSASAQPQDNWAV